MYDIYFVPIPNKLLVRTLPLLCLKPTLFASFICLIFSSGSVPLAISTQCRRFTSILLNINLALGRQPATASYHGVIT